MALITTTDSTAFQPSEKPSRSLSQLLGPGPQLSLHGRHAADRHQVESYVAKQFEATYGANINEFMPLFMSLGCNDRFSAVTGIKPVEEKRLFLEQYLEQPIEQAVARVFETPANRLSVVEIGNLAATQRGSSQLLFVLLAATLHRAGFRWITFTATPQVRKTINRLGFELRIIDEAKPERLGQSALQQWGSYYQTKPLVVVGDLNHAMQVIRTKRTLSGILALYCNQVETLAAQIKYGVHHGQYRYAA